MADDYGWPDFLRRHACRIRFRSDGCWEWTGARIRGGYGAVTVNGQKALRAHRVSWTLLVGPIPPRMTLDHLCRHPWCINPDHMEPVTATENRRRAPLSGWAKIHAAATHCRNGHPFDGHNGLQRTCSTCRRDVLRRWNEKQRRKVPAV